MIPEKPETTVAVGSLKWQAITGLFWMVSQSVLTKVVSVAGQISLAYLLLPEHFAAISLTYTVATFAKVLENGGLREVLIYHAEKFHDLANAAFWLSLTLGACSGLIILTGAPAASRMYQSSEVFNLLLWMSIQPIIASLASIPTAKLQTNHRFRLLAGFAAIQGCTQTVTTVVLATCGFGAFSFVLGNLLASMLNTINVWVACPHRVALRPEFAKWPNLWKGTITLSLVGLATTLIQQVDYMMLGIFQSKLSVGYYFFAFGIASQAVHLLMQNIATVFLPLLCKIQSDARRQLAASLSAFHVLAGIGLPLSFLQCGLIDPCFHLLLPDKWLPSIPMAQILSLGLGLNVLSSLCWSLLKSQGRFHVILTLNWLGAIPFTVAIFAGAAYGTAEIVAVIVSAWCAIYSPLALWLSIKRIEGSWRDVFNVFAYPTVASVAALLIAWVVGNALPESNWRHGWLALTTTIVFSLVYFGALHLVGHALFSEARKLLANRQPATQALDA